MVKTKWMKLSKTKFSSSNSTHLLSLPSFGALLSKFFWSPFLRWSEISIGWISRVAFQFSRYRLTNHESRLLRLVMFSMFSTVLLLWFLELFIQFPSSRSRLSYKICLSVSPNDIFAPPKNYHRCRFELSLPLYLIIITTLYNTRIAYRYPPPFSPHTRSTVTLSMLYYDLDLYLPIFLGGLIIGINSQIAMTF